MNFHLMKIHFVFIKVLHFYFCNFSDAQQQTLFYQVEVSDSPPYGQNRNQAGSIAKIFTILESNKDVLNLETYSLSQTSLEQVFIQFARNQASAENPGFDPKNHMDNSFRNVKRYMPAAPLPFETIEMSRVSN